MVQQAARFRLLLSIASPAKFAGLILFGIALTLAAWAQQGHAARQSSAADGQPAVPQRRQPNKLHRPRRFRMRRPLPNRRPLPRQQKASRSHSAGASTGITSRQIDVTDNSAQA